MILAMDFNGVLCQANTTIESICIALVSVRITFCAFVSPLPLSSSLLLLYFFCLVVVACFFLFAIFPVHTHSVNAIYLLLMFFFLLRLLSHCIWLSNINLCNVLFRLCLYLCSPFQESIIFYRFNELLLKIAA